MYKSILTFVFFLSLSLVSFAQEDNGFVNPLTTIEFVDKSFDFGEAQTGDIVEHRFEFTNTGQNDLNLTWVKASCGCTTVQYAKEPISPGENGFVDIKFNLRGRVGHQLKFIWVQANTDPAQNTLQISGDAVDK